MLRLGCSIEARQNAPDALDVLRVQRAPVVVLIEPLEATMAKPSDHAIM